eukprot:Nk52_evm2s785 gene=Nk52_evmTU2s785
MSQLTRGIFSRAASLTGALGRPSFGIVKVAAVRLGSSATYCKVQRFYCTEKKKSTTTTADINATPITDSIPCPQRPGAPPMRDHFDLIVLGSGPAAQKCAIDAAKRYKKVALVDGSRDLGGVCVHTGTIPSKTFREAVLHLTGYRHQGFYGKAYQPVSKFSVEDILYRVGLVVERETNVIRDQLRRNGIVIVDGKARFVDEHKIVVNMKNFGNNENENIDPKFAGESEVVYSADHFLIGVGTRPARRDDMDFDARTIFDSDQILQTDWQIPRDLVVVGSGVIGMEYASMINVIPGSRVTVIDERPSILPFADREVIDTLCYNMRQQGARFLLNEKLKSVQKETNAGGKEKLCVQLESGKRVYCEALLYAVGRQGNTDGMDVEKAGLKPNKRGLLSVNENFQTSVPHIYAAGDCVGFPALASTSMEQGRLASCHMWGFDQIHKPEFFPYGIYTIPEVSMVGKSEEQLTEEKVAYEVGISRYEELAKGQMLGGGLGFLKLLFCPDSLKLLGVHAIGEGATEIIHIGQTILSLGGTVDYFRESVFNYPTLAEAYRVAALNGLQKVHK